MDCRTAQQEILERLTRDTSAELDAHVAGCPTCAAFSAAQTELDRRLSRMLTPPDLSRQFRPALRRRMRSDTTRWLLDTVPDLFHFIGWAVITTACATLVPLDPGVVAATGAAAALLTYVLFAAVRSSLYA